MEQHQARRVVKGGRVRADGTPRHPIEVERARREALLPSEVDDSLHDVSIFCRYIRPKSIISDCQTFFQLTLNVQHVVFQIIVIQFVFIFECPIWYLNQNVILSLLS